MEGRNVEITLISAKDLKDVNRVFRMNVYAVVTINGDARTKQKTPVYKDCGTNPGWNYTMKFPVVGDAANQDGLNLVIRLMSHRHRRLLSDKVIGEVVVPIKKFLECEEKDFVYGVRLLNGTLKGTLNLRSRLGETFSVPVAAPLHVGPVPPQQRAGRRTAKVVFVVILSAALSMYGVDGGFLSAALDAALDYM